jgi:hypothetical protein
MTRIAVIVQTFCFLITTRNTIAPSRNGSPRKMSVTREMIESTQPPKKPASSPKMLPTLTMPMAENTAISSDGRAPWIASDQ